MPQYTRKRILLMFHWSGLIWQTKLIPFVYFWQLRKNHNFAKSQSNRTAAAGNRPHLLLRRCFPTPSRTTRCWASVILSFVSRHKALVWTFCLSSGPSAGSTGRQRWLGQGGREARTRGHLWNQLSLGELQQRIWHARPASSCKMNY